MTGDLFGVDSTEVHTYLANMISGNSLAESKTQLNLAAKNRRLDFIALQNHYLGVGIISIDVIKAETTLETLYTLEKRDPTCSGRNLNQS